MEVYVCRQQEMQPMLYDWSVLAYLCVCAKAVTDVTFLPDVGSYVKKPSRRMKFYTEGRNAPVFHSVDTRQLDRLQHRSRAL